ncbi:MAG: hypothetical protein IJT31_05585 [Oscillibacter sp.]|nr:hypothetical protein [Oscillibacter sp.]
MAKLKKCRRCGMMVPDSAIICPYCRREFSLLERSPGDVMGSFFDKLLVWVFVIFLIICVIGMATGTIGPK